MHPSGDQSKKRWPLLTQLGNWVWDHFRFLRSLEDDVAGYAYGVSMMIDEVSLIKSRILNMNSDEFIEEFDSLFCGIRKLYDATSSIDARIAIDLEVCVPQLHPRKYPKIMRMYSIAHDKRDEIMSDLQEAIQNRVGIMNLENMANGDESRFTAWFHDDDDDDEQ